MNDIWRMTATEVSSLVRAKKISAREAMASALARLEQVNPLINAVVDYRPEYSLAQADAVDAAIARGEMPGPLTGVPITIKVLTDQAGFATTNGLTLQRDLIARTNSPMVDNFLKAGATIVGRTNTPAFSYRWFTNNKLHGHTKNPRNNALTPGGSSGGASAATVAGIGHIGHGTDIAGSVRYPAYAVGIHGLRLTLGRAPNFNASGPERSIGSQIMAVSGPLARTIADLRLALEAMAAPQAPDARDPWYVPVPIDGPKVEKRAALCIAPDGLEVASEVKAALVDAAKRLERAGWTVEEIANTPPLQGGGGAAGASVARRQLCGAARGRRARRRRRRAGLPARACRDGPVARFLHLLENADPPRDADARLADVLRQVSGAADAGVGRIAVRGSARHSRCETPGRGSGARRCR